MQREILRRRMAGQDFYDAAGIILCKENEQTHGNNRK